MADKQAQILSDERRPSGRPYLAAVAFVAALAITVVLAACGDKERSPAAPSDPRGAWPTFVAPGAFGGLSIVYPSALQPTAVDDFRIAFGGRMIPGDTDMPGGIEFSSYIHPVTEEINRVRSSFEAIQTDTTEIIGGTQVFHLVGRLNGDVFGWGGTIHGHFIFAKEGRTVVVDYNAEDSEISGYATEMVRRTLAR